MDATTHVVYGIITLLVGIALVNREDGFSALGLVLIIIGMLFTAMWLIATITYLENIYYPIQPPS